MEIIEVYEAQHKIKVKDVGGLTELFVDADKKRTTITPKCTRFLMELQTWFKDELFSYAEAKEFGEAHGYSMYATSQWLNMLWKYDSIRKFCTGIWEGHKTGSTSGGKYWGVHYQIKTT